MKQALVTLILSAFCAATIGNVAAANPHHHKKPSAVTLWWVIFNAPENCYGSPDAAANCTSVDVFGAAFIESMQNGVPDPTLIAPNLAAEPAVVYATGGKTDARGRIRLAASIYRTPVGTALDLPPSVDPMGFGRGFENADAEVHLVVRDHGRARNRDLLPQTTAFLDPYCSDPNLLYFAGRNTCVDTHFAVFGAWEAGTDAVYAFADPSRPVRRANATLQRTGDVLQAVVKTRIR